MVRFALLLAVVCGCSSPSNPDIDHMASDLAKVDATGACPAVRDAIAALPVTARACAKVDSLELYAATKEVPKLVADVQRGSADCTAAAAEISKMITCR